MNKVKYKIFLVLTALFAIFQSAKAILNGNEPYNDITSNTEFGCQWLGGDNGGISCTCTPDAPEFLVEKGSISSYSTVTIKINYCNRVRFANNAISTMRNLRTIEIANINSLQFDDSSLFWDGYIKIPDYYNSWERNTPALKISIENSTISQISSYAFKGRIKEIILRNVIIQNIAAFGFSSILHMRKILFINVEFQNFQAQAFKKCNTEILLIDSCTFETMPSRTFSDVIVTDNFSINNCTFNTIRSSAFLIQGPTHFEIRSCKVNIVEGEGFKITTRGSATIKNSVFNKTLSSAFRGISLNKEEVPTRQELLFDSVTFNEFERDFLVINATSFVAKFNKILLNETCDCTHTDRILENLDFSDKFTCLQMEHEQISLKDFKTHNCSIFLGNTAIYIILGVTLILFILIFSGLVIYFKRTVKHNKQSEYITDSNGKSVSLIVPDGRTYRETELHVIVERADLLTTDL